MKRREKSPSRMLALLLSVTLMFVLLLPAAAATSESDISVQTTLTDGMILKGSKKTFDVIARLDGNKIDSTVTLNNQAVNPTWSDTNKDSYTLVFTEEGENIVEVTAASGSLSKTVIYHIQYEKAQEGDLIGYAIFTVETLTLGTGFLVEPIRVPIYEGENSAQLLDRVLTEQGFAYDYTGKLKSGFYLSVIANGGHPEFKKAGCQTEGARLDKIPEDPSDSIPATLREVLESEGYWPVDTSYYVEDEKVYALGEFEFTYMSGWMYAVNGVFPNVGFSDTYPTDGDVIRTQFTLYGYGADIGGGYAMGGDSTDFYTIAQKDRLLTHIAAVNSSEEKEDLLANTTIKAAFQKALSVAEQLDASQEDVDASAAALDMAVQAFRDSRLAAGTVDALIDAIGTATLDSEEAITAARAAYDALTEAQRALVTKLDVLTAAEKTLSQLKIDAAALAQIKAEAKAELASYKNAADYREAEQSELAAAIAAGKSAIDSALDKEAVEAALKAAKTAMDAIKTDAQMKAEASVGENPKTGDSSVTGTVILMMLAAAMLRATLKHRKIQTI